MKIDEEDYVAHYGTPRRSGRYPWGTSGWGAGESDSIPRNMDFLDIVADLRKQGLSDSKISEVMGFSSTTQFRARRTIENNRKKQADIRMAQRLKDKGMSNVAIGQRMSINESSVRALLAPGAKDRADILTKTSEMLKRQVDEKRFIDVGSGVENHLKLSKEKLGVAVEMLKEQGYQVHKVKVPQIGTGLDTERKVLGAPDTTQREVWEDPSKIKQIMEYSPDGGHSWGRVDHPPISVDPKRIEVRYKENGGGEADGVIYVRPGVEDISLGKSQYAQVRVLVGDTHYLKGMAMYKNDLPPGTDLVFNTSKTSTGNKLDAMKPIGDDKDYPFGSVVRQIVADPGGPNERNTSAMNIVYEQGDWAKWNRNLSSQFLSKQNPSLARTQLDMTYERRRKEFDEINALTNPTVKKKLLEAFADSTDTAAVNLKAAALPRSNWHAILPIESMPPTQIYAPNYRNGDRVALIRYPHGGTFEIPKLIVNNRNPEARSLLGDTRDAVGIHHSVAHQLSGADFDGDTVIVIPDNQGRIKISPPLEELQKFDPIATYKVDGPPTISSNRKQQEMGKISNLITDMTLQGAPHSEIVRAIKHSMVVIDSEKHNLDYKQSAIDNGIAKLKTDYQGRSNAGASTLISRKKSFDFKPERKLRLHAQGGPIDPTTGQKVFVDTGRTRRDKEGNRVPVRSRVNRLADTPDAFTLSSGTPMETLYAEHSNRLKSLANEARLSASRVPLLKYSPSARKIYSKEVDSLNSKLDLVLRNRPLEREAQTIANTVVKAKRQANPNLDKDSIKKIKFQELEKARRRTKSDVRDIVITKEEWNAIQAGAISDNKLSQILAKSDLDVVRKFATPRREILMTPTKTLRAKSMLESGYSRSEVAEALGVSLTTLDRATTT